MSDTLVVIEFLSLMNYVILFFVGIYSITVGYILTHLVRKGKQRFWKSLLSYGGAIYTFSAFIATIILPPPSVYHFTIVYLPLAINGFVLVETSFRRVPMFRELHYLRRGFFLTLALLYLSYIVFLFFYLGLYIQLACLLASVTSLLFSYLILAHISIVECSKIKFLKSLFYLIFSLFYFDAFLLPLSLFGIQGIIIVIHLVLYYLIITLLLLTSSLHLIDLKLT